MIKALGQLARHGRFVLVAGLLAGLALPDVALALRPWLGE
jgi:arsenite transporter